MIQASQNLEINSYDPTPLPKHPPATLPRLQPS